MSVNLKVVIPFQSTNASQISVMEGSSNFVMNRPLKESLYSLSSEIAFEYSKCQSTTNALILLDLKISRKGKLTAFSEDLTIKLIAENVLKKREISQILIEEISGLNPTKQLSLKIGRFIASAPNGGLATGPLRFLHLLHDIVTRYPEQRLSNDMQVCIIGPGLFEGKSQAFCPQLVELMAVVPRGKFLLLDNDQKSLEQLRDQIQVKGLSYDPFTLVFQSTFFPNNHDFAPAEYQPTLRLIKEQLGDIATSPSNSKEMLMNRNSHIRLQEMNVGVKSEDVEVREFDITSSDCLSGDQGKFDVIVATLSIINAMNPETNPHPSKFIYFEKFLSLLKSGGSFYIDACLYQLLDEHYSDQFKACLEKYHLTVNSLNTPKDKKTTISFFINPVDPSKLQSSVSTYPLYVLTRTE